MPRTKLLVSALALALGGATAAQAQTFSNVVTFGDSLSDNGNVAQLSGLPAGFAFTTNPDSVYSDIVAAAFGFNQTNSLSGGSDYAVGGACARANSLTFTCANDPSGPAGVFSITNQLGGYLAAHGGQADPNALYMMWGGANDIFTAAANPGTAQLNTGIAAQTMVGLIGTLQQAGANTIVVFNLPDLGLTPLNVGTAAQAGASGLSFVYNSTFNGGLATLGDGIVSINTFGLINEIVGDPSTYGFTDVTHQACGVGSSSVACGPTGSPLPYHWAAGTNETYLFADGVHPTGAAHAMLANVVIATLSAPGQVSMAGEIPLQMYDDHSNVINDRIFGMAGIARTSGETNAYGHLQYSQTEFKASSTTSSMDSDLFVGTFGADVQVNDAFDVGAAVSVGNSNGNSGGASVGGTEVLVSAYGVAHFGRGYVDAIASGGSNSLSIDRSIVLGPTTRVENGSTNATHTAFEMAAGWTFGSDSITHGPFVSWTWQQISVDGYAEDSLDSTSMYFNDFDRNSSVTRAGYQLFTTSRMGNWRPFGRIAFAYENDSGVTAVQAGSNTLNGHFTLDGFQTPDNWAEADLGVSYALNDNTSLSFAYRGRFDDNTQDVTTIDFGLRYTFGNAPPPPPAEVAPATSCADLDDDGDGVNNCDDKCPTSEAGQAIGPDGCPVPLTIDLKGVNFDFDKDTLRPDAIAILDEAISILGKYPELKVEVAGHTDSVGTEVYNQGLSERRARTVYDYLSGHGIGTERMVGPVGYGETKPIAPNDTSEGRAENRRTELNVQN